MNNNTKSILIVLGIIAFLFWVFSLSDTEYNEEGSFYENSTTEEIKDDFSSISEPHWTHMPLEYSLVNPEDCEGIPFRSLNKSFEILTNLTSGKISFEKIEGGGDIEIVCFNKDKAIRVRDSVAKCKNVAFNYSKTRFSTYEENVLNYSTQLFIRVKTLFRNESKTIYEVCYANREDMGIYGKVVWGDTLGEALPLIEGNILVNSTIYVYDNDDRWITCSGFPSREIHELLHSFGFGHSYEPYWDPYYGYADWSYAKDIMFPYLYCNLQRKVDEKYISCLSYIYSNGEDGICEGVNFLTNSFGDCSEGWYPVEGTDYCCPEPFMRIDEEGYCALLKIIPQLLFSSAL